MFEIARSLEQTAVWFKPAVLIVPGLVAVLLGLFIWLGGLGFRRILAAIVGAVSGGICGFFISGRNIVPVVISTGITMFVAVIFEKIFIAALTGILAAVICFAFFAKPYIGNEESLNGFQERKTGKMKMYLDAEESVEMAKGFAVDFVAEVKQIFFRLPGYSKAVMTAVVVFFTATAAFRQRLTAAFCCAALGSMLIFAGMIMLLLYKGAAPVSSICRNQVFYQSIFGIMTAFGLAVQLLLCQRIKEKMARSRGGKESEQRATDWRNR
jgi:hypothetical protein